MNIRNPRRPLWQAAFLVALAGIPSPASAQTKAPAAEPGLERYGIYGKTAPRAAACAPTDAALPQVPKAGERIALIGNTLLERLQEHGHFEAYLQKRFPERRLSVRNLAWPADEITLRPRPENFADLDQHLTHERADVVLAAFGFNESFAGEAGLPKFKADLAAFLAGLKSKAFNGKSGPRIVLVSPIGNENVPGVPAATLNEARLRQYVTVMREVARDQKVGFADVFEATANAMKSPDSGLTFNGVHLTARGYDLFSRVLFAQLFGEDPPALDEPLRQAVIDKDLQFYRRYRPLNSFYYTGDRNKLYGYLDFLPAMRNFDLMVDNRDRRVWDLAQGRAVPPRVDDSNVPPLPPVDQSRGVNPWLPPEEERQAFKVDPRFEVNLFAGEERFPEIANPIQMRWDARGRLWVSCSSTYPHAYPGKEPRDRLVVLEDSDGDGKADRSTIFAEDLHVPLSFEFGDGGVYVSEQPHLTFLKDTDGDGKADVHRIVLTGFGTEDSHHALHDFAWTPDGALIFRESIFHHSQVETPYGPVRLQNSGWFRFDPATHRLTTFGSYPSTNPWGVTFDDWGRHVASHPIFAAAFHSVDPAYPQQNPAPKGLQAYSGTCGHEFIDFPTFPPEMQGGFVKARYKPTNRIEFHKWKEGPFGCEEEYVGDLLFSTNLSFIPVDVQFGPRGELYVCDWYNPVKGHAQYALRDERRDRHSGRIWRITTRGVALADPPKIAGATVDELLELLKRPEYRCRYWAKRELRDRDATAVKKALDAWVAALQPADPRYRHHQTEALWTYGWIGAANDSLLRDLLACDDHHARSAAVRQLRERHPHLPDAVELLRKAANDPNGIVRMEAAIAASYVGTKEALDALLEVFKHPRGGHLEYAISCALGSRTLKPLWEGNPRYDIVKRFLKSTLADEFREPKPTPAEAAFDRRKNLKSVTISCVPERMLFTVDRFDAAPGQPVKIVFTNPDATDHNLAIVKPDALVEVGTAANEMARDPKNANSDFIPADKRHLILHATPLVGERRGRQVAVLRFAAPSEPGVYPFLCTFPGHWIVMKGDMVVASSEAEAEKLLAARKPAVVKEWKLADFPEVDVKEDEAAVLRGMQAFLKANCHQCHAVGGHGQDLGPDLCTVSKRFQGVKLLKQILEPSAEILEAYRVQLLALGDGRTVTGVVVKEEAGEYHVVPNLLTPTAVTRVAVKDVDEKVPHRNSPMPEGLLNVLTREEILDLMSFLEFGYKVPALHRHAVPSPVKP